METCSSSIRARARGSVNIARMASSVTISTGYLDINQYLISSGCQHLITTSEHQMD